MSFAGHVFDMIRRNKEDREALRRLRSGNKNSKETFLSHLPDTTVEEMEEIEQNTKKREQQDERFFFKGKMLFFAFIGIIAVVVILIFKYFA